MPSNDAPKPRKELKDVPMECDSLHKELTALNIDSIATRFIGILRVTALRVIESFASHDKRLRELEAFRDDAMKAYLEAKAAAEALPPVSPIVPPEVPPKSKGKDNGHAKKASAEKPAETKEEAKP